MPGGGVNDKSPKKIKLDIWDTAGDHEIPSSIHNNFLHGAHAIIIVYSIDSPNSFKSVSNYVDTVDKLCPASTIKVIVGNKCDLDKRRVNF